MGATSITGISGPGAAYPGVKGPGNDRNVFVPTVGPNVVAAGVVASPDTFVELGNLGDSDNFIILARIESTGAAVTVTRSVDVAGNLLGFTVGTTGAIWTVVRVGLA